MRHIHTLDENEKIDASWITIGAYDGIHCGHQALIQTLVEQAHQHGELAVVVSLFPHPALVLGRTSPPFYLTSPEDRAELLEEMGVDVLYTYPFSVEVSNYTPRQFMQTLTKGMNISQLWVGDDFALGKDRQGTLDVLQQLGDEMGYVVHPFNQVKRGNEYVSSSAIRKQLKNANLQLVEEMLGRNYAVRGRLNAEDTSTTPAYSLYSLHTWAEQLLPPAGNYGCNLWSTGLDFPCIAGIQQQNEHSNPVIQLTILNLDCPLPAGIAQLEFLQPIA